MSVKKDGVETRKLWTDSRNALWIRDALNVPNGCSVFCVERTVRRNQCTLSCDVHYFISSLDLSERSLSEILALLRGHWQVENCLHLTKDRWRDEDKHLLARPGAGVAFTSMLNTALSVSRFLKKKKEPMTAVATKIRDKPKNILKKLGFTNEK